MNDELEIRGGVDDIFGLALYNAEMIKQILAAIIGHEVDDTEKVMEMLRQIGRRGHRIGDLIDSLGLDDEPSEEE